MAETGKTFSTSHIVSIYAAVFLVAIIVRLYTWRFAQHSIDVSSVVPTLGLGISLLLGGMCVYASRFYADRFYSFLSAGWFASSAIVLLGFYIRESPEYFSIDYLTVLSIVPFYIAGFLRRNDALPARKILLSSAIWLVWIALIFVWLTGSASMSRQSMNYAILTLGAPPLFMWSSVKVGRRFRDRLNSSSHGRWSILLPLTFYVIAALQLILIIAPFVGFPPQLLFAKVLISSSVKVVMVIGLSTIMRIDQIRQIERSHELREQSLRRSEIEELGYLTAGIIHEIRSPLGTMNLQIETMKDRLRGSPELSTTLEEIQEQMKRIHAATQVIQVLRGSKDYYLQLMEKVSAEDLIKRAVSVVQRETTLPYVHFRIACKKDVYLRAYQRMLEEAVVNVLENAVDAIRDSDRNEGIVTISVARDSKTFGRIRLVITDNGCGIPAENIETVASALFTTKGRQDGHQGLGLFISNRVVSVHGGEMLIESKVGVGTTIYLLLPEWTGDQRITLPPIRTIEE